MELLGPILRDVSRSFYISIRLLPTNLREPVGIAYLLARATDTLADTAQVPAQTRASSLKTLAAAIQNPQPCPEVANLIRSFASQQTNEAERKLIESLPRCLEILNNLSVADQADIRQALATINRGQTLDIERPVLATADELDEYTYLVAGCVGEFWTRLCFRHVRNFSTAPEQEMRDSGRRYGMGLQLINILRDAGNDLKNGRCYFPAEELHVAGLAPEQILATPDRFMPVFNKWLEAAEQGLNAGLQYVRAVRDRRVRGATALPVLIGARTASLLRSEGSNVLQKKVKVSRPEVRKMMLEMILTFASQKQIETIFSRAGIESPAYRK